MVVKRSEIDALATSKQSLIRECNYVFLQALGKWNEAYSRALAGSFIMYPL